MERETPLAGRNIRHLFERVGITSPSLEGAAATRWRIHKELRDSGEYAALQLLGRYNHEKVERHRLYDFLNLPNQAPLLEDEEDDEDDDFRS